MSTNRLVTTNNTLNWDALREEKFGGAMLTGSTADSVGAISVEAKAPCSRISYKSWEENFRAAVYFIGEGTSDPFSGGAGRMALAMHIQDIPNFIALLQKTYDGMSELDKEVKEAYDIIKKASM